MGSMAGAFLLPDRIWNNVSLAQMLLSHWPFTFSIMFEGSGLVLQCMEDPHDLGVIFRTRSDKFSERDSLGQLRLGIP